MSAENGGRHEEEEVEDIIKRRGRLAFGNKVKSAKHLQIYGG